MVGFSLFYCGVSYAQQKTVARAKTPQPSISDLRKGILDASRLNVEVSRKSKIDLSKFKPKKKIQPKPKKIEVKVTPPPPSKWVLIENEVKKSRGCPVSIENVEDLKMQAMERFKSKENQKLNVQEFGIQNGVKPLLCKFDFDHQEWIQGNLYWRNSLIYSKLIDSEKVDLLNVATSGVYAVVDDKNLKSYRSGGLEGDHVFFKIKDGMYLRAVGWTQDIESMESDGFYEIYLIFTPDFFVGTEQISSEQTDHADAGDSSETASTKTELQERKKIDSNKKDIAQQQGGSSKEVLDELKKLNVYLEKAQKNLESARGVFETWKKDGSPNSQSMKVSPKDWVTTWEKEVEKLQKKIAELTKN